MAPNSRRGLALLLLVGTLLTGATATAQATTRPGGAIHADSTGGVQFSVPIVIKDTSWGDCVCPPYNLK
ncbi:hypothetical protein LN042_08475 [Kitasatospora sp. RB6PN24]|uniref:hypothetical protein n=1 Tax=Kitasatospora humi TaxID=2893891 RepID=UPI001E5E09F7|nr:hypothetical protein [Kitasatospora humi]MCC9307134.1 hypothetical protein [Kitasatospora humi]